MVASKNYPMCIVQMELYRNNTKSNFVIRKLRRNNEKNVKNIKRICDCIDNAYEKLGEANSMSETMELCSKQTADLYQRLLNECGKAVSEAGRVKAIQEMNIEKSKIDKNLEILKDAMECTLENCERLLCETEERSMELYAHVNNSNSIFPL